MGNTEAHHESGGKPKPALYVVATPIGNLRDISLRALDILKNASVVAAEDTRVTAKLLHHHGIAAKLVALHEHNEKRVTPQLLALLERGKAVALVSDAGTPAISDPGAHLVAAVRAAGYAVTPVPGPNAAVTALSAAGFADSHFLFYGFLPPHAASRRRALAQLAGFPFALLFYEAPHRVLESVADMCAAFGVARRVVIARELTKLFETFHACALAEAAAWLEEDDNRRRGEFVLIVEGATPRREDGTDEAQRVLAVLLAELPLKQAVALAAKLTSGRRNDLYELALKLKGGP